MIGPAATKGPHARNGQGADADQPAGESAYGAPGHGASRRALRGFGRVGVANIARARANLLAVHGFQRPAIHIEFLLAILA